MSIFSNNFFVTTRVMTLEEQEEAKKRQEEYKKQEALNLQKQEAWEIYKKRMKLHCAILLNKLTPIYEKYSKEFNPDWKINVWHSWDKPPRFYVVFTGVGEFRIGEEGIAWDDYEFSAKTNETLAAAKFYEYLINSDFLKEIKEVINFYPFEY